jgi:hypothetical protein
LTLREEQRLRGFENRVVVRTFGPKRDEMLRSWRKTHNEKFHYLYSSLNIITMNKSMRMGLGGHGTFMGQRSTYKIFVTKPEGKRPLGRPKCKWEDILKWIIAR